MSILPVEIDSVAVNTYADFKTVLTNEGSAYNDIQIIYLYDDITLSVDSVNDLSIYPGWSTITIDGHDPFADTETMHEITDVDSTLGAYAIGIRSPAAISITFQNMKWIGRNYYGMCYVPPNSAYQDVELTFNNVDYRGRQMVYNRYGTTQFINCKIESDNFVTGPSKVIGEVCRVEIGGNTQITHNWNGLSDPVFWFVGTSNPPCLTISRNATVTIATTREVVYTDAGPIPLTICENGTFVAITDRGFFTRFGDRHRAESIMVEENAVFKVIQTKPNELNTETTKYSTFYCDGEFVVKENAEVYMRADYPAATSSVYAAAVAAPVLHFSSANANLRLENCKRFAIYSSADKAFAFDNQTTVTIDTQQINQWDVAGAPSIAGGFADIPEYSWRKTDGSNVEMELQVTASSTIVVSHNLNVEELEGKAISNLAVQEAPVFAVGTITIATDIVADDGYPITGTTEPGAKVRVEHGEDIINGVADSETGDFSISAPAMPVGNSATIGSNSPFLITRTTVTVVDGGDLYISYAPDTMRFILSQIAATPVVLYGRDNAAWTLTVMDTRVHSSPWMLSATITAPLTSVVNPAHTVPDALVYIGDDNSVTLLSANNTFVYMGDENGGAPKETSVTWETTKGILIQSTPHPYYNKEEYRAPIGWKLFILNSYK